MADTTAASTSLLTALTTEHFALQGIRGTGNAEATSRASLYLAIVSSTLIALGFVSCAAARCSCCPPRPPCSPSSSPSSTPRSPASA